MIDNKVLDRLHLAACTFASKRKEEAISFRKKHNLKPFDEDKTNKIWVAHYEGFRDGVLALFSLENEK